MGRDELITRMEAVEGRTDLAEFVEALCADAQASPSDWENRDLPSFLSSMAAWIRDMDGYYANHGKPFSEDQSWRTMAEILYAATMYE